jgi:hypothetical protein
VKNLDYIRAVQRSIAQLGKPFPAFVALKQLPDVSDVLHGNDRRSFEAAMWEGWPVAEIKRSV